jgi:hypothetical protein
MSTVKNRLMNSRFPYQSERRAHHTTKWMNMIERKTQLQNF